MKRFSAIILMVSMLFHSQAKDIEAVYTFQKPVIHESGSYQLVYFDLRAMIETIRDRFPGKPIYLMGHSLGGQLAVLYSAMLPETISGVILIACGSVHFRNWQFPQNLKMSINISPI